MSAVPPEADLRVSWSQSGGIVTMSYLFAAVLLFSTPGCPHEEPTCITQTKYVEVNLRPEQKNGSLIHAGVVSPGLSFLTRYGGSGRDVH